MTAQGFFKELQRILHAEPKPETVVFNSENCIYCDHVFDSKNLSYCFDTAAGSDATYLFDSYLVAQSLDCDYTVEAESCYECVDAYKCYNCFYVSQSDNVTDAKYGYLLSNCHDVFGCTNLKNKSYCIFNRQLSKEEYFAVIEKYKKLPAERALAMLEQIKLRYPITQSISARNVNSPYGNFIYDSKNCYMCFDAARCEDCGYLYDSFDSKFSYDLTYCAKNNESSYQIIDSLHIYNCSFALNSTNCQDSSYLFNCKGVKNSLGCVGLQYKEYCILNRQFSKEEYEKIASEIIKVLSQSDVNWDGIRV